MTFDCAVRGGVCRIGRPATRWLSTGYDGGTSTSPAAYNCTVPEGWDRTDLDAYVTERLEAAGFGADATGPALLTGVAQRHARRARLGSVEAVATAGLSNPALLPVDRDAAAAGPPQNTGDDGTPGTGTVNIVVGTSRALPPGALATLLTVAAEAKTATLLAVANVPGTTTDAVVAACDPDGESTRFAGSATPVGAAARACVRDAVAASLRSRGHDGDSDAVAVTPDAGVVTDAHAVVSPVAPDD